MTISDKQARQRLGWLRAQGANAMEALDKYDEHAALLEAYIEAKVAAGEAPAPQDPPPDPEPTPDPAPVDPPPPVIETGERVLTGDFFARPEDTAQTQAPFGRYMGRMAGGPPPPPSRERIAQLVEGRVILPWRDHGNINQRYRDAYTYDPDADPAGDRFGAAHPFPYIYAGMGAGGWRPDIGPAHEVVARYVADPTPERFAAMASAADGAFSIGWHIHDAATGRPVVWMNEPWADKWCHTAHGKKPETLPVFREPPWVTPDVAHTPAISSWAGLLTGEPHWLAAGVAQAGWHIGHQNPGNRQTQPIWDFNARIGWWGIRDLILGILCAEALGWEAEAAQLRDAEARQIAAYAARIRTEPFMSLGVIDVDPGISLSSGGKATAYSSWQADMGCMVLGWAVRMGREQWRPILAHIAKGAAIRDRIWSETGDIVPWHYRTIVEDENGPALTFEQIMAANAAEFDYYRGLGDAGAQWWMSGFSDARAHQTLCSRQLMNACGYDFSGVLAKLWSRDADDPASQRAGQYMIAL